MSSYGLGNKTAPAGVRGGRDLHRVAGDSPYAWPEEDRRAGHSQRAAGYGQAREVPYGRENSGGSAMLEKLPSQSQGQRASQAAPQLRLLKQKIRQRTSTPVPPMDGTAAQTLPRSRTQEFQPTHAMERRHSGMDSKHGRSAASIGRESSTNTNNGGFGRDRSERRDTSETRTGGSRYLPDRNERKAERMSDRYETRRPPAMNHDDESRYGSSTKPAFSTSQSRSERTASGYGRDRSQPRAAPARGETRAEMENRRGMHVMHNEDMPANAASRSRNPNAPRMEVSPQNYYTEFIEEEDHMYRQETRPEGHQRAAPARAPPRARPSPSPSPPPQERPARRDREREREREEPVPARREREREREREPPRDEYREKTPQPFPQASPPVPSAIAKTGIKNPLDLYDSAAQEPEAYVDQPLEMCECGGCGRSFNIKAFAKHEKICQKVFQRKRKKFDDKAQRLADLENDGRPLVGSRLSQFEKKQAQRDAAISAKKAEKAKAANKKWRLKSEAFRASIRAARGEEPDDPGAAAYARGQLEAMEESEGTKVSCPNCGRTFNEAAGERHMKICQSVFGNRNPGKNMKCVEISKSKTMNPSSSSMHRTQSRNSRMNNTERPSPNPTRSRIDTGLRNRVDTGLRNTRVPSVTRLNSTSPALLKSPPTLTKSRSKSKLEQKTHSTPSTPLQHKTHKHFNLGSSQTRTPVRSNTYGSTRQPPSSGSRGPVRGSGARSSMAF